MTTSGWKIAANPANINNQPSARNPPRQQAVQLLGVREHFVGAERADLEQFHRPAAFCLVGLEGVLNLTSDETDRCKPGHAEGNSLIANLRRCGVGADINAAVHQLAAAFERNGERIGTGERQGGPATDFANQCL